MCCHPTSDICALLGAAGCGLVLRVRMPVQMPGDCFSAIAGFFLSPSNMARIRLSNRPGQPPDNWCVSGTQSINSHRLSVLQCFQRF
jgi:hypothetical protein